MTTVFDRKLARFAFMMKAKIEEVAPKYGGSESPRSVLSDRYDWANAYMINSFREHLLQEIGEWLKGDKPEERELVDIANCAFILCMLRIARSEQA